MPGTFVASTGRFGIKTHMSRLTALLCAVAVTFTCAGVAVAAASGALTVHEFQVLKLEQQQTSGLGPHTTFGHLHNTVAKCWRDSGAGALLHAERIECAIRANADIMVRNLNLRLRRCEHDRSKDAQLSCQGTAFEPYLRELTTIYQSSLSLDRVVAARHLPEQCEIALGDVPRSAAALRPVMADVREIIADLHAGNQTAFSRAFGRLITSTAVEAAVNKHAPLTACPVA